MQSLSKYNKGMKYLLCVIDDFSKYTWVVSLKDKRGISIINAFQKIISKQRKPKKTNFQKGGLDRNSTFRGGLLGKRGYFFQGCCNFHIKNIEI